MALKGLALETLERLSTVYPAGACSDRADQPAEFCPMARRAHEWPSRAVDHSLA